MVTLDSMVNALLVYPAFREQTFWSFKQALRIVGKKANMPPYGLATIAAMLPDSMRKTLVDENVRRLTDRHIAAADVVFASAMIAQRDSLHEVITRAKNAGKHVVVGGPLIGTGYAEVRGADTYFIGEAEQTMPLFLSDFAAGTPKRAYAHVTDPAKAQRIREHFEGSVHIIVGPRPNLALTPVPRFDLLDIKKYASMAVQLSRGCPHKCDFCDIWTQTGTMPRLKPAERLVAELDALHRTGYRGSVFIVDDNFIGNRVAVKEKVLPALINWQKNNCYPFSFYTEATVTMADDTSLLTQMRDAGFDMVFCGIETPNEASLREAGKRTNIAPAGQNEESTLDLLLKRVRAIQEAGLEVSSGFILGFDSDPPTIGEDMIRFIEQANIPMAMVGLLAALPETKLYERLQAAGRIKTASAGNNTHAFELNFTPLMPEAELLAMYGRVLNAIYPTNLAAYYGRVDRMMDIKGTRAKVGRGVDPEAIRNFLSALNTLIPTSQGWQTLKFLARRLSKSPSTFPEAVAYAVKGHHFASITRTATQAQTCASYFDTTYATLKEYVHNAQGAYQRRAQGV